MKRLVDRAGGCLHEAFEGDVSALPYDLFRIGVASLTLLRSSDWLRPVLDLDHHAWVRGLEYHPAIEMVTAPALSSPLVPGLALDFTTALVLVWARTLLAILLLVGFRTRTSAGLLALVGITLVAADRYRYLHHLHLMWLSVAWIALTPTPTRFSIDRLLAPARCPLFLARWPLSLLRLQCMAIYLAAGTAKLSTAWISGRTLEALSTLTFPLIGGSSWETAASAFGLGGLAVSTIAIELGLVPLLLFRRTRLAGVALGILFHAAISEAMIVSTFTPQMIVYLLMFLPFEERRSAES